MSQPKPSWSFYGRRAELAQMRSILDRRRWFFLQISGRRRIGKTTLIQEALDEEERTRALYMQIPDSDPAGVVAACNGYLETFGMEERVTDLGDLAKLIGRLVEDQFLSPAHGGRQLVPARVARALRHGPPAPRQKPGVQQCRNRGGHCQGLPSR